MAKAKNNMFYDGKPLDLLSGSAGEQQDVSTDKQKEDTTVTSADTDDKPAAEQVKKRRGRPPIKTEQTRLINVAVPVDVYNQIQIAKLCYNNSTTQYINTLIKHDLEKHMDKYEQTVQLLKEFR